MKYIKTSIILIFLVSCYGRNPEKTGFEGQTVPSFKILLLDSTTYFDTKDIQINKPFVLFFFSPACPYCRAQMEQIIKDINLLKNIQFYIITNWSFEFTKQFNNHYRLNNYENLKIGTDYKNFFGGYFKAKGVPYLAIYGKDKKLKKAFIGNIDTKQLKLVAEE